MVVLRKRTNYRKKYPGLSDEIINILMKSDRKMEYQEYDLKVGRYLIDSTKQIITYIACKEDSYDRLSEENRQFASEEESVEDAAIKAVMLEKMLECLKLLTPKEQTLITELFFNGKSERRLSAETGVHYMTIHDRKIKILNKIKKFMEK